MEIFSAEVVHPIASEPIRNGALALDGKKIAAVGALEGLKRRYPKAKHRAFPNCCLLPGLVNTHTHLDLTLFPTDYLALEEDSQSGMPYTKTGFVDWIGGIIHYRKNVPQQTFADAISEGIDRSLRSGTTTVGDITTLEGEFALIEKSGIRAVLFPELISFDAGKARDLFEGAVALLDQYEGGGEGLIRVGLSPHAPYTVSRPLLKIIQEYSRESKFKVQIHVAESFQEMEFFFDAGGEIADKLFPMVGWNQMKPPCVRKTPIEYLHSIDFLKCSPTLVHCVQVSDRDLGFLSSSKCHVVLCPRSNHFLRVGKAPVARLLESGIPLALGTDSLASNASLSLWDEMRFLKRGFAAEIAGKEILRMATLGGANALGIEREVGSFAEGKAADLIAVRLKDFRSSSLASLDDYLIDHTYDADIQLVMVDGEIRTPNAKPASGNA